MGIPQVSDEQVIVGEQCEAFRHSSGHRRWGWLLKRANNLYSGK